jgi:predicted phosphodiesterase
VIVRLAVLSDIHGNLPALEAVLADMTTFDVDHVVVAGDSINWGPHSAEVIERIMQNRWAVIRGNHEFYMLEWERPEVPEYRRAWTLPRWLNETIPVYWRRIIASLPDTLALHYHGAPPVQVIHASPGDHWRGIYESTTDDEITAMLRDIEPETVIVGHTHLQMQRQSGRWQIVNPGSVGNPLNGIPGAYYMLLEGSEAGWTPVFRRVEYDRTPVYDAYERLGFVEKHGGTGLLMIEEIREARPLLWGYINWRGDHHPNEPDSVALAEAFLSDPRARWDYLHPEYHLNLPVDFPNHRERLR